MTFLRDLPAPQHRALEIIREVAVEKACRPFLVGGPVRDVLLGRTAIDIDLTLEDGSSTLARALARRIDGRVRSHPQFLTYKVTAEGFPDIDIATARKERYRQPGALPAVTAGRLRDDLLRRDFSINAIALDLLEETLHDPVGGKRDVEQKVVRVLHDRSFIDDPTRIFRAIRLATRLGFEIEPHTAALMESAIESGAFATVSRERLWRELFLAMDEENAPEVLEALAGRGVVDVLLGRRPANQLRQRLEAIQRELALDTDLDRYVMFTGALLQGDASPVDLDGSGFSQKRARSIFEIANELPHINDAAAAAATEAERFRIYRRASREALAALIAANPDRRSHVERFHLYRRFVIPLRGNDLGVPPGPHVAKALEAAREAVFSGEIPPEKAKSFAQEVAAKLIDEQRTEPAPC